MRNEIEIARTRNIIEMAWDFSGMRRVFEKGAGPSVCKILEEIVMEISETPFRFDHKTNCQRIRESVKTTDGKTPSFGQAAKVLDIAMKVIIGYCRLPNEMNAPLIEAGLYGAIDTPILHYLKRKYGVAKGVFSLSQIDQALYYEIQSYLVNEAKSKGCLPIAYDDWKWRNLSREPEAS
jgi:hypothetical protein